MEKGANGFAFGAVLDRSGALSCLVMPAHAYARMYARSPTSTQNTRRITTIIMHIATVAVIDVVVCSMPIPFDSVIIRVRVRT
jgi:hypothetical protein